jgi:hypothetical protein
LREYLMRDGEERRRFPWLLRKFGGRPARLEAPPLAAKRF